MFLARNTLDTRGYTNVCESIFIIYLLNELEGEEKVYKPSFIRFGPC